MRLTAAKSISLLEIVFLAGAVVCTGCGRTLDTQLFRAASDGDLQTLKSLIDAGGNVNARDSEDETPLMHAAVRGQSAAVLLLLNRGADVNAVSANGETALDRAALVGQSEAVKVLAEKGANVNIGGPLIDALSRGHMDTALILIEKGADVNFEDTAGDAALSYAARQGATPDLVKAILAAGGKVKHRNKEGKTAEDLAVVSGHKEVADLLRRNATSR